MLEPTFDYPAIYRIKVKGRITEKWRYRLAGMSILHVESISGFLVTTMEGELVDQADLAGVLNTLYELHLPLLEVEYLNANENAGDYSDRENL